MRVLDHGFVRLVESWGGGDAGEAGAASLAGDLAQLPPGLRAALEGDDSADAVAQDYARAHGLRTLAAVGVPRG